MPRRSLFLTLLVAALLVPAATSPARAKYVTVSFSGSGGTEKDNWSLSRTVSENCTHRTDGAIDASGIGWKVRFKRIPIPRKGQVTFKTAQATLSGTETIKVTSQADPGCESQPPAPLDCAVDLAGKVRSAIALRRKGSKVTATLELFSDRQSRRPDEEAGSSNGCGRALRGSAFVANIRIPASARSYKKSFDQSVNRSLPEPFRPHFEVDQSDFQGFDGRFSFVSDVAWGASLSARYLR